MSKRSCPLLTLALLIGMAITTSLALALPEDGWDSSTPAGSAALEATLTSRPDTSSERDVPAQSNGPYELLGFYC
jgi:hypothetical protein